MEWTVTGVGRYVTHPQRHEHGPSVRAPNTFEPLNGSEYIHVKSRFVDMCTLYTSDGNHCLEFLEFATAVAF